MKHNKVLAEKRNENEMLVLRETTTEHSTPERAEAVDAAKSEHSMANDLSFAVSETTCTMGKGECQSPSEDSVQSCND